MEIILIANYEPDRQPSMQRFARLMEKGLLAGDGTAGATAPHGGEAIWQSPRQRDKRGAGAVQVVRPPVVVNRFPRLPALLKKWLGYVDKFVLFPVRLRALAREAKAAGRNCVFHICDHSNAMYVAALRSVPHVVTCHDVFAIRAARGEVPDQPTGFTGRLLQRMITVGLRKSGLIACDSEATRRELVRVVQTDSARTSVVPLHVDSTVFHCAAPGRKSAEGWRDVLQDRGQSPEFDRYLLHVGGGSWYKNRDGVLRIFRELLHPDAAAHLRTSDPATVMLTHRGHGERNRTIPERCSATLDSSTLRDRTASILVPRPFGFAQGDEMSCPRSRHAASGALLPDDRNSDAQSSCAPRHPDLGLVLVGPPLSAAQWNLVGEDLRSRVICLQNLDDANLAVLYRGAEALLFPSLDEGFGWPVLEANACGCPAIISRRGSLPEVGGDAAVYIDPADEAGSARTIEAFLRQSPAEREQALQSALRNAARFSQDATVDGYLVLYERAVADAGSLKRPKAKL